MNRTLSKGPPLPMGQGASWGVIEIALDRKSVV